jgi:hypothetical protein
MSIYKKGQKSGEGKFNKPVQLNEGKGDGNGNAKGTSIAREVYNNNNAGAIRGGRPDRDENGR